MTASVMGSGADSAADREVAARDRRGSAGWARTERFVRQMLEPGFGRAVDADDLAPHPDGTRIAFATTWWTALEGRPGGRIGMVDADTRAVQILSEGPHSDRSPAWSPDGGLLAYLTDR